MGNKKLAISGGKSVRNNFLPYGRQWINDDDIQAVIETLKGDYLTTGPKVDAFERVVADYVGANYAVAFSNGTAALHAAVFVAGIKEGDEVITTPLTFAASANAVLYCGGTPVFADINYKTMNIDPEDIEKKITSKTKAIIPVDFTGQSVELARILEIADKHNLIVIEDSAHALGTTYKGKKIGNQAHMTEFSFHPVKHITTGEGGIITTNDENLFNQLKLFRTHGITRDPKMLENTSESRFYYEQQDLGYNYRITDIQCALGISQMNRIDDFIEKRRNLVEIYNELLKDIREIQLPYEIDDSNSSWHLYVIRLRLDQIKATRNEVFDAMLAENIGVNVHYVPVYYHPYYKKLGYQKGLCPNAEKTYEEIITLPLFPKMDREDVEDVVIALKKVLNHYRFERG